MKWFLVKPWGGSMDYTSTRGVLVDASRIHLNSGFSEVRNVKPIVSIVKLLYLPTWHGWLFVVFFSGKIFRKNQWHRSHGESTKSGACHPGQVTGQMWRYAWEHITILITQKVCRTQKVRWKICQKSLKIILRSLLKYIYIHILFIWIYLFFFPKNWVKDIVTSCLWERTLLWFHSPSSPISAVGQWIFRALVDDGKFESIYF